MKCRGWGGADRDVERNREKERKKRERDRWGERESDREMERERWEINEGKMSPSVHSSFNNLFAISFSKEEKEVKKNHYRGISIVWRPD